MYRHVLRSTYSGHFLLTDDPAKRGMRYVFVRTKQRLNVDAMLYVLDICDKQKGVENFKDTSFPLTILLFVYPE